MNKKNLIVMCICLVIVAAAVVGIAVMRFGGNDAADDAVMSGNADNAQNNADSENPSDGFVNEDTVTDTKKPDNAGNAGNIDDQKVEIEVTITEGSTATTGVAESDNDSNAEEDFGDSGNTGSSGAGNSDNSGNVGDQEDSNDNEESGSGSDNSDESSEDAELGVTEGDDEENFDDEDVSVPDSSDVTYESYNAMSGAEQQAFIDSFGSVADFVAWYNAEKAEYEAEHPSTEIGGDGTVDAGQIG